MAQQNHIIEIPALLNHSISRRLIFAVEGLTIEKSFGFNALKFIPAENLAAIRMGVNNIGITWLNDKFFSIGKQYVIELKLHDDSIVKINLNSLYNLRAQDYDLAWADMVKHLYSFYFSSQLNLYIELFQLKQSFNIAGINFYPNGISWDNHIMLRWNQVSLSNYQSYFVIHHRQNVHINKSFNFLDVWNAHILQAMLKYAVEDYQRMFSE